MTELDTGYIDAYGNPIYSGDTLNYCYAVRRNVQLHVCTSNASCREVGILAMNWAIGELQKELTNMIQEPVVAEFALSIN